MVLTMALIIPLTAGDFDLSVASMLTLSAMILAVLNAQMGINLYVAIAVAVAVGAVTGAINAWFILYFRIPSLIVTLGTGTFINGIVLWMSFGFNRISAGLAQFLFWTFAVLMETCFLVLAPQFPDRYLGTVAIFAGLVILIGAGVGLLATRMGQTELAMRESFLRMEYRLAQLAEELNQNRGQS